ncbi:E3 SUMO-protein ligase KIAA1586-like [Ptychodera flava]
MTYLHSQSAQKDPAAKGLLKYMATTQFIFITYLMMDVIPVVSKLCLDFQSDSLDVAKAKVSLDLCIADLEAYKQGTTQFQTHVDKFESVVQRTEDGHYEYSGHRLQPTNCNLTALKSTFVNKLISNIRSRFPEKGILDAFYILAMRTIRFESDVNSYGAEEIETLLNFYGEKQTHKGTQSDPLLQKNLIRTQWLQAKLIVKSAKYPVDNMANLWTLLHQHHAEEIPELIKLAQIALVLPLHTAGCERVFSQQNIILTKLRNRLSPQHCDRLLRVRLQGRGLKAHDFEGSLKKFHDKKRMIKTSVK